MIVGDISIDYTWIRYQRAPTNDAKTKQNFKESTVMAAATVGAAKQSKNQF